MWQHVRALDRVLPTLPDFVLLQLFVNDFETGDMVRPRARPLLPWTSIHARLLASSVLYGMLEQEWEQIQIASGMAESYAHYMSRHLSDPNSPASRNTFGLLRDFIHRAGVAGVPTGIVFFPNPERLDNRYPFAYLHERVASTCAEEHIRCVDLRNPFALRFHDPSAMWVSRFDRHPSAQAHATAADAIRAEFEGQWREAARHLD
jgi:hypothetical protein